MAKALDEYLCECKSSDYKVLCLEKDVFIKDLQEEFNDDIIITPSDAPNIINIAFKDIDGDTLQLLLSNKGFIVSTGSACHSGSSEPSYVLQEIGVPKEYLKGEIRISFSPFTKPGELYKLKREIIFHAKYLINKVKGE